MADRSSPIDGKMIAQCVERFRAHRPHIHCITNSVAQQFTANAVLAAGGTPSMTIAPAEVGSFVEMADALLINLGTMDDERTVSIQSAVATATVSGKPWALDPVFVQASPGRLALAKSLLPKKPTFLRYNAAEGRALLSVEPDAGSMHACAREHSTTLILTGVTDTICGEEEAISVENGSHLMDRVTAMGCALTALVAGFGAIEDNPLLAAAAGTAFYGLAGEVAERTSAGPGSFVPAFLDALHTLSIDEIENGVALS